MKKLLMAVSISVAAAFAMVAPASAQIYPGAQYGGVEAGPYDPGYGYADSYWNYRPGGYANGAVGGYNNSSSSPYGSYAYGGYGYPTYGYPSSSYGTYGYAGDPYAGADAFASAPGANCRHIRQRVMARGGRVTHRMRTICD